MRETFCDSETMRRFAGIEPGVDRLPDETTILNFRHLLERHGSDCDGDAWRLLFLSGHRARTGSGQTDGGKKFDRDGSLAKQMSGLKKCASSSAQDRANPL